MKYFVLLAAGLSLACAPATEPELQFDSHEPSLRLADIGKACTPDSPATVLSGPILDSLRTPWVGGSNLWWAEAALTVPGGVGGVFLQDDVPYIYLTDTTRRVEAVEGLTDLGLIGPPFDVESVVAVQARWDFAQLADWYEYLVPKVVPHLRSSDIQEGRNRLEFGVADEPGRELMEGVLKTLDLPCNLVAIRIAPTIGF